MVLLPGRALECDPVRPRYIHCDGMQKLIALPCMSAATKISHYAEPDINVEWRRHCHLATALANKVVWGLKHYKNTWYLLRNYMQFNWKRRVTYHYAHYTFMDTPFTPNIHRCLYLFRAPFRWLSSKYDSMDCENLYPLFRDLDLLEDGTPDVAFSHNLWDWSTPPDPQFYTVEEWHLITHWEEATFYYDHDYLACIARHNHLDLVVTETSTGRTGVVKDIVNPQRQTEWWEPSLNHTKYTVKRSQWRKILPLEYLIQVPDGRTFTTTRRKLMGL